MRDFPKGISRVIFNLLIWWFRDYCYTCTEQHLIMAYYGKQDDYERPAS